MPLELRAAAALAREHGVDEGRDGLVERPEGARDEELRELVRGGALGLALGEEAQQDRVEERRGDHLQLAQARRQHVQHLLLQVHGVVLPGLGWVWFGDGSGMGVGCAMNGTASA